jgi:hypothetical protein
MRIYVLMDTVITMATAFDVEQDGQMGKGIVEGLYASWVVGQMSLVEH